MTKGMAGTEMVYLNGVEYEKRPCDHCGATGRSYDSTMAGNINAASLGYDHGFGPCPSCSPSALYGYPGHTLRITPAGMAEESRLRNERRAPR